MKTGSFLFLGTGSSTGIPIIGCHCPVCSSSDPKNKRLRACGLIKYGTKQLLLDAGPDIRQQALRFDIRHIDGLLLTHSHFDHIGGLEELRAFSINQKMPVPCLLSQATYAATQKLFYYLFCNPNGAKSVTARFDFFPLPHDSGKELFCLVPVHYFHYFQGSMPVTGFRVDDLAYVTDIKEYPESIFDHLQSLSTLIVSALRFTKSTIQFSIDEAIDFAQKVGAKTTYLMHMSHGIEHEHLLNLLPPSITLAYDGLEIPIEK